MEYISTEEFLKQPKEIQKMFLNWWKPKEFELVMHTIAAECNEPTMISRVYNDFKIVFVGHDGKTITVKRDLIPLLSEGQLRKFIEDKTGCNILEIRCNSDNGEYFINAYKHKYSLIVEKQWIDLGTDLLQAYWKVALEIAKEKVKE